MYVIICKLLTMVKHVGVKLTFDTLTTPNKRHTYISERDRFERHEHGDSLTHHRVNAINQIY